MSIDDEARVDNGQDRAGVPALTPEQRAKALEAAKATRQARAQLAADLKAGKSTVADVFAAVDADSTHPAAKMQIGQVVKSLPGVGRQTATEVFEALCISMRRRVRGLGVRQRAALLEALETRVT